MKMYQQMHKECGGPIILVANGEEYALICKECGYDDVYWGKLYQEKMTVNLESVNEENGVKIKNYHP